MALKAEEKQAIQQKYMELQIYDKQIKQIHKQMEQLEMQILELDAVKTSLNELAEMPSGRSMLVPLAAGVYADAELKDPKTMLVNVGANTVVKKTVPEVHKLLNKQADELRKLQGELSQNMQKLGDESSKAEQILNKLIAKAEGRKE